VSDNNLTQVTLVQYIMKANTFYSI